MADHGIDQRATAKLCIQLQEARSANDKATASAIETQIATSCEAMSCKFARYFAKMYRMPLDDVEQECRLGVLLAARKYDGSKASFAFYVSLWAKRLIQKLQNKIKPIVQDFESNRDGDSATDEEPCYEPPEHIDLSPIMSLLTQRERYIVDRLYGLDGMTPETTIQIAAHLGTERSVVSRYYSAAIRKIRDQFPLALD